MSRVERSSRVFVWLNITILGVLVCHSGVNVNMSGKYTACSFRVYSCACMNAIQIQCTGGPEVLQLAELEIPVPGPGQVLIRVEAIGVNFIEIYFRKGTYKATLPLIPGSEAAGTIEELGSGVTGFKLGDAVASCGVLGSYAEYALVPATQLVKVPDGVTMEQAAASMLQGMTAHYLVHSTFPLKAGDTAL